MEPITFFSVQCPYCGEPIECAVDASAGESDWIEDCAVCCRPIEFHLAAEPDGWQLTARREDD